MDEEKILIEKSVKGDQSAYELLFNMYSKQIKAFLVKLSNNEFDANDMFQDTFLKAYVHIDKYDPKYPFVVWLKTIARNTFLDYKRRNALKNKVLVIDSDQVTGMQVEDISEDEQDIERSSELIMKIDSLDDKYREVMELRYYKGLDYKEIAEELGVPMSSVKTRLFRAKNKLK